MTTTEIKLTPAMDVALSTAKIQWSEGFNRYAGVVLPNTKAQTVKGLHTRGLTDPDGFLTESGVEWARQLGAEIPPPVAQPVQDEPMADWERELLELVAPPVGHDFHEKAEELDAPAVDSGPSAEQAKLGAELSKLLDTPKVVPNRKDKRHARFSLKGAYSRLVERKRQRKIKKYGTTKYNGEAV